MLSVQLDTDPPPHRIHASENWFKAIIENIPDPLWIVNAAGRTLYCNAALSSVTGYTTLQLQQGFIYEFLPRDQLALVQTHIKNVFCGNPQSFYGSVIKKSGEQIRTGFMVRPLRDNSGAVSAALFHLRRTMEEGVFSSDPPTTPMVHAATLGENSHAAMYTTTLEGTITSWNLGAEKLYGYSREEVLGTNITDHMIPLKRWREFLKLCVYVAKHERIILFETVSTTKTGEHKTVLVTLAFLYNTQNQAIGASVIAHDTTSIKGIQKEQAMTLVEFEALFEKAPVGLAMVDIFGRVRRGNAAFSKMLGEGLKADVRRRLNMLIKRICRFKKPATSKIRLSFTTPSRQKQDLIVCGYPIKYGADVAAVGLITKT